MRSLVVPFVVVVCAVGASGLYVFTRPEPAEPPRPSPPALAQASTPEPLPAAGTPPPPLPTAQRLPAATGSISRADETLANTLVEHINRRGPVSPAHVESADGLFARNATPPFRDILEQTLLLGAQQEAARRDKTLALDYARRAFALKTGRREAPLTLVQLLVVVGDWTGVESAAREMLASFPRDAAAWLALGQSLFRQDRNREAADAIRTSLQIEDSGEARQLLERIEKASTDEQGMTQQQLAHFHVRYDGGAHEGVGREILRALERHYATLARTLDHQPTTTIPVILFTREGYYNANGAPAWSGGNYDTMDGRIRIPIGGLTESLSPDMDDTLIHELTHAFAMDRSRNVIPRDVNEGLAQYLEGKRIAALLSTEELGYLANGRAAGVYGFYVEALAFVEYLMGLRGQGGMNDLLASMGITGSVDEAFRSVHGQDYAATKKAWRDRLRQQYGN